MPRTVGLNGRRPFSSGGAQAFQFEHEERGPLKFTDSIASGTCAVLVQSQRSYPTPRKSVLLYYKEF